MFETFQHYLSYGATDQQTVKDLSASFDGLLIPGTVAAFQAEGTKGFVLSLSARSSDPYVIDSRFPLFQNQLASPKKSHSMLALILGAPELVRSDRRPTPDDFTDELVERIATKWIQFNVGFQDVQTKTFDKYAARLKETVLPENRQEPLFIFPPYTMASGTADGWADVSARLWTASVRYAEGAGILHKLRRVVAGVTAQGWSELAASAREAEIATWISDLDEFRQSSEQELGAYARGLLAARSRGQKVFALYGGFFAVLLARFGLTGASHGIGFGEHRDWVELPSSGAPPPRYYVPRLHRYLSVDLAEVLWRQYPELIGCDCYECNGAAPASLDYHSLMRHSVRVRSREIDEWAFLPTAETTVRLRSDFVAFKDAIRVVQAPASVLKRLEDVYPHLAMWARVLDSVS